MFLAINNIIKGIFYSVNIIICDYRYFLNRTMLSHEIFKNNVLKFYVFRLKKKTQLHEPCAGTALLKRIKYYILFPKAVPANC